MIVSRTRYSLAQFLELHETAFVVAFVSKHDIRILLVALQLKCMLYLL